MKNRVYNIILLFCSLIVTITLVLLLGEAYFRIVYQIGRYDKPSQWVEFHEERGWSLKPGTYSTFDHKSFRKTDVFINSLGLRDKERSLSVPGGMSRTSIVGDSFVFGEVLNFGERFTEVLQEKIAPKGEIVNISTPGYGTGQEILFIENLLANGYEVGDKLILVFFTNDILDNLGQSYAVGKRVPQKPVFQGLENGKLVYSRPMKPAAEKGKTHTRGLLSKSVFYHFIRNRAVNLITQQSWMLDVLNKFGVRITLPRVPGIVTAWYTEGWEKRWKVTEDLLNYLASKQEGLKTELLIAFIPSPFQVEESFKKLIINQKSSSEIYKNFINDIDRPQRMLREFCSKMDIQFIDATSILRRASISEPVYFPQEGHLNIYGSGQLATLLYESVFQMDQ